MAIPSSRTVAAQVAVQRSTLEPAGQPALLNNAGNTAVATNNYWASPGGPSVNLGGGGGARLDWNSSNGSLATYQPYLTTSPLDARISNTFNLSAGTTTQWSPDSALHPYLDRRAGHHDGVRRHRGRAAPERHVDLHRAGATGGHVLRRRRCGLGRVRLAFAGSIRKPALQDGRLGRDRGALPSRARSLLASGCVVVGRCGEPDRLQPGRCDHDQRRVRDRRAAAGSTDCRACFDHVVLHEHSRAGSGGGRGRLLVQRLLPLRGERADRCPLRTTRNGESLLCECGVRGTGAHQGPVHRRRLPGIPSPRSLAIRARFMASGGPGIRRKR